MSRASNSSWRFRAVAPLLTACGLALAVACSASSPPNEGLNGRGATGSGATGSGATGSGASGGSINPGSGGTISPGGTGGGNPQCVRIGMFGRPPSYGATQNGPDNTDALQSWLDAHVKAGTTVDTVTMDTPITTDLLGKYDVIILQALDQREGGPYWTFSPTELSTFEAWVRGGGAVISLTGYGGDSAEVTPTNQLLAFTGMSYNVDDIFGTCPDNCCYCAGSSIPVHGWHADHPIAANITAVGAFHGRSINAGNAALVASEGSVVYGATKELDAGRVFFFFDEWVTYSSQWTQAAGTGGFTPDASCLDPNNMCYGRDPADGYQVPQFWYNALKWATNNATCFDFTADVPVVR